MNRRLDFLTPVFHSGANLTVRNGLKWADVQPGQNLDVYQTGAPATEPELLATVISAEVKTRDSLTDADLTNEHDPSCRTVAGLNAAMEAAYGPNWGPCIVLLTFDVQG